MKVKVPVIKLVLRTNKVLADGSHPIDVAKLKVSDCSRVDIDGVDYWALEFKRQKTKRSVSVRIKRDMFSIILLEHFLGFTKTDFVYPIITLENEDQQLKQSSRVGERALYWVKKAFEEINAKTIVNNAMNDVKEPLVDVQKVVLYSARHAFASAYLNSAGATVRGAASLLARSPNTIAVYIHALQNDKEIADAVSFLSDGF